MAGQLTKLLITPVDMDCNMACKYCYNGSSWQPRTTPDRVISIDTIYKIFDEIGPLLKSESLVVVWHGGEPMLAGKDFYREMVAAQRRATNGRYKVSHCMQTNGTLVDAEWVELFGQLYIGPSVSIDGPAHLHDAVRVFLDGAPTYDLSMRAYRALQERGIDPGLLVVISQTNVKSPGAIWEWVLEQQFPHFDFLLCIEPELWRESKQVFGLSSDEATEFSIRLFDLWFAHGDPDIRVRTFRDAIKSQIGGHVSVCSWKAGCAEHLSFDASGNAFPCSRYHCYPETCMGNIHAMSLQDILHTPTAQWVVQGIQAGQARCDGCKWKKNCGSGCPFLKYALNGAWDSPYVHCRTRQALFEHIRERIFQAVPVSA